MQKALEEVYRSFFPDAAIDRIVYSNDAAFQRGGRDLCVKLRRPRGDQQDETIEEKIRAPGKASSYDDLLIEYLSNAERGTLGWIYTSKATWLSYIRQPDNAVDVLILSMPDLRTWFIPRLHNYEERAAQTHAPGGGTYTTLNKVVPFSDPAFQAFSKAHSVFRRRVELRQPLPANGHAVPPDTLAF